MCLDLGHGRKGESFLTSTPYTEAQECICKDHGSKSERSLLSFTTTTAKISRRHLFKCVCVCSITAVLPYPLPLHCVCLTFTTSTASFSTSPTHVVSSAHPFTPFHHSLSLSCVRTRIQLCCSCSVLVAVGPACVFNTYTHTHTHTSTSLCTHQLTLHPRSLPFTLFCCCFLLFPLSRSPHTDPAPGTAACFPACVCVFVYLFFIYRR